MPVRIRVGLVLEFGGARRRAVRIVGQRPCLSPERASFFSTPANG
jgi:hypothetical protein